MQQFKINSQLIEVVAYDQTNHTMYIQFVDRGVLMIQQIPIENVNAFLSSQDKDIFLKDQLMANPSFRRRIQKRSTIAKSLFPN